MNILAFSFGFKDLIDILLVAGILYETYRLLRKTGAANLFWGILAFIVVWFMVSFVFQLDLTGALFDRIIPVSLHGSYSANAIRKTKLPPVSRYWRSFKPAVIWLPQKPVH